jgi:hypothetical protein
VLGLRNPARSSAFSSSGGILCLLDSDHFQGHEVKENNSVGMEARSGNLNIGVNLPYHTLRFGSSLHSLNEETWCKVQLFAGVREKPYYLIILMLRNVVQRADKNSFKPIQFVLADAPSFLGQFNVVYIQ